MQYIGTISLLARLSNKYKFELDDMDSIELAIRDFCIEFPGRFEYEGDVEKGFHLLMARKGRVNGTTS